MTVAWDHVTRADVLRAVQEYDRASALPPLISRAASPVPSGCSKSSDLPSSRDIGRLRLTWEGGRGRMD
jgi:hypothetical protein